MARKYLILYSILITTFIVVNIFGTDSFREVFIDGDGSGHYAYLPTLIIYHTVDFADVFEFEKSQRPLDYMGHYFHKQGDILINKYTAGTALLQLPFFLIAYILSFIFGLTPDGYNIIFQYCIALSAVFWVGIGISYFVRLLKSFGIIDNFGWLLAVVTLFGTNLFFYTFIQPSFSHTFSFTVITMFLYYARTLFQNYSRKGIMMAAFSLGLVFLVRPANIIVIAALPFVAETPRNLLNSIKQKLKNHDYLISIPIFILAISPQLIINYLQTGSLIIYGYKNEGFYFDDPQIFNFLFSYQKGWFVYTPLYLLLFPALVYLWRKKSVYSVISFLIFFGIQVYVFSSWWNWYYGDSFGMRPMVDYYGFYSLVIAIFIYRVKGKLIKIAISIFVILMIIINMLQSYQYAVGIIHPDSMSKKSYWHVFFNLSHDCESSISCGDETFYGSLSETPFFITNNYIDDYDDGWKDPVNTNNTVFFSDSLSVSQTTDYIYSPSFNYFIPDTLAGYNNIYVRFSTMFLEMSKNAALKALFVVDISDKLGEHVFYKAFGIKPLPNDDINIWKEGSIGFKLPQITDDMYSIKFYIWNAEKQSYLLDDIKLKFYTYGRDK